MVRALRPGTGLACAIRQFRWGIRPLSTAKRAGDASSMADEYGHLDSSGQSFVIPRFELESGEVLLNAITRYNTYGNLNSEKDNVLVVCHALTGNSRLDLWWGGLLGPGKPFDTGKYFVFCANVLGSCYGSSGPASINPSTQQVYGRNFPKVTIRDSVRAHISALREQLGVRGVRAVVGGSMGGMQALEWALLGRGLVRAAVTIGCNAQHSAWQIAVSEAQRQAIYCDPKWCDGHFDPNDPPTTGLSVARQMAMISYRSPQSYAAKFGRQVCQLTQQFEVQKYLQYQGSKFHQRFDAWTYVHLTEQLDSHDVFRGRRGDCLGHLEMPVLVMGMDSDSLYPLHEQQELHRRILGSEMITIRTDHGHDGFLLEQEQVGHALRAFLAQHYR